MTPSNQTPGGYKFAPLVAITVNNYGERTSTSPFALGYLLLAWSFPSRSGVLLHAVKSSLLGYSSHLLPGVTKDFPISPRYSPTIFDRDASSALLNLVNRWLNG